MPNQSPAPQSNGIAEAAQQLALDIYGQMAVGYIEGAEVVRPDELQQLAKHAQLAALAYFEALGVKFEGGEA